MGESIWTLWILQPLSCRVLTLSSRLRYILISLVAMTVLIQSRPPNLNTCSALDSFFEFSLFNSFFEAPVLDSPFELSLSWFWLFRWSPSGFYLTAVRSVLRSPDFARTFFSSHVAYVRWGRPISCVIPGSICSSISLPAWFCHFPVPMIFLTIVSLISVLLWFLIHQLLLCSWGKFSCFCASALILVFLTRFLGPIDF
jgi:hypothetical protein